MIDILISECKDDLLKLRDAIQYRNDRDWDVDWQIDQVHHAISIIERLRVDDRAEQSNSTDRYLD